MPSFILYYIQKIRKYLLKKIQKNSESLPCSAPKNR